MSQLLQYELGAQQDVETVTADTGTATPDATGNINAFGGDGVVTSAAGDTVTISQTADAYTISTVQTTDATPTTLFSFTLGEDEAITVDAKIMGAVSDYSAGIGGTLYGVARKDGAAAAVRIGAQANFSEDVAGDPSYDVTVSGNDVRITVTGVAATTINWRAQVSFVHQTA